MPEVTGAVALDLKALAELADHRLDQPSRAHRPAREAARAGFFHIAAHGRLQLNALTGQLLLQARADEALVAQQQALDGRQVQLPERVTLVLVGRKQGPGLQSPPHRWSAAAP
jgi:hypothetical protein